MSRLSYQDLVHEGPSKYSEVSSSFDTPLPARSVLDETVEISPIDSVKRHSTDWYGVAAESIYAPLRSRIKLHFNAPVHLLVLYEDGARRGGETSVGGLPTSTLRKFANKVTFVPAGHRYREWHETSAAVRMTFLYLDPTKLQKCSNADPPYIPRVFFEDSMLWATVLKVKGVIEGKRPGQAYLDALVNVLAHELSRSGKEPTPALPGNRGGLASWQKRAVTVYIEERLNEQISLVTLARLVRLSLHHFCRAFKQSFGVAPYRYHLRRRMQQAKVLLSDRASSVAEVGLNLGYSNSSSFSLTFRKITGQTPMEFRRSLK